MVVSFFLGGPRIHNGTTQNCYSCYMNCNCLAAKDTLTVWNCRLVDLPDRFVIISVIACATTQLPSQDG